MKNLKAKFALALCTMLTISSFGLKTEAKIKDNPEITIMATHMPKRIYKKEFKTFPSIPPKKYYMDEEVDGVRYSGSLTLLEYQSVDGGYIATYAGYIYR